jgi:hypothetical protein
LLQNCFVQNLPGVVYLCHMRTHFVFLLALSLGWMTGKLNAADSDPVDNSLPVVSNVWQLAHLNPPTTGIECAIRLTGSAWWVNSGQGELVLHDATGTALITTDLSHQEIKFGRQVLLEGAALVTRKGAGFHLRPNGSTWSVSSKAHGILPDIRWIAIGQILNPEDEGFWAQVEGEVTSASQRPDGWHMELTSMGGTMHVLMGDDSGMIPESWLHRRVRATGFCQSAFTTAGQKVPGVLLVPGKEELELIEPPPDRDALQYERTEAGPMTVLTNAITVNQLSREQAQEGYSVRIKGVVVCVVSNRPAFIVQDATRAVYVVIDSTNIQELPPIGYYLQVTGKTDKGSFAPIVRAREINFLGLGNLPEPIRPSWDQLINGSLDDQWVELKGIIVSMTNRPIDWTSIRLRTEAGTLPVDSRVFGTPREMLRHYNGALVRMRGCLFVSRDERTDQVRLDGIRMYVYDFAVDEPAPTDPFSLPQKSVAELRLFDPRANAFQRAKVSGQIVYARGNENFLMDGTNGLRFVTQHPLALQAGDLVEVTGFPELGGPAPILSEADARKTGHAALPEPKKLALTDLIQAGNDSTLVQVQALLAGLRLTETNEVLEMQAGSWRFLARLNHGLDSVPPLRIGSLVHPRSVSLE